MADEKSAAQKNEPKITEKKEQASAEKKVPVKAATLSQDNPTKMPARDKRGFVIDQFGLPVNGPARKAVLARLAASDPVTDLKNWTEADFSQAEIAKVMEQEYGR